MFLGPTLLISISSRISATIKECEDGFKVTIQARNAAMYLNEKFADVHFIVGSDEVRISLAKLGYFS